MSYGYKTTLEVDGSSFEISAYSYEFEKEINEKGEVISPLNGGIIYMSLHNFPTASLLEWGLKHRSFKNGVIQVVDNESGNHLVEEEVSFENAACTNMKIIYERNSSNYITTLMTISPQDVCLGRNGCWINKNWTTTPTPTTNAIPVNKDALNGILDLSDISIDCIMELNGSKYEIQAFETEFIQPEDHKGEPQHEVKGGLLLITLKQKSDSLISKWMFQRDISHSGVIVFAPKLRVSSIPFSIVFTEAKCISFNKSGGSNIGTQLTLLISAKEIAVNGVKHTNSYR